MRNQRQHGPALLVTGVWLTAAATWLAAQPVSMADAAALEPKAAAPPQEHVATVSRLVARPPRHALVPNPQCSVPAEADMVRCDTIVLEIPVDAIVTRVVRKIREVGDEVPHGFWIEDDGVYRGCRLRPGWCSATAIKHVTEAGKQTFSYDVKNWKFDRDREFLLEVHYTQPSVTGGGPPRTGPRDR